MGFIYIIRNTINSKVYIGQTINTIKERFNQHIWRSHNLDIKTKIYKAIQEIGEENFYVEQLIECDNKELNKYEQYYVEKYDSLNNGYNSVYPCSSSGQRPVHDYEDKLIDMYLEGYSFAKIAKACNISCQHVNKVVLKHNLSREYENIGGQIGQSYKKEIIMYSKEFKPLKYFNSIADAYKWLGVNTEYKITTFGAYAYIDIACQNGNICYGHRWQLASDLLHDDKLFRTKFDKEAYLQGKPAYQPDGEQYYIVDGALDSVKTFYKEFTCIDCGAKITYGHTRCLKCNAEYQKVIQKISNTENKKVYNKEESITYTCSQCGRQVNKIFKDNMCISCINVIAKGKSPKPSKEELESLLKEGLQKKQIAELYNRTDSTIQYWIDSYGLLDYKNNKVEKPEKEVEKHKRVQKKPDTSGVTCVELSIHFNSFKEAAEYLISNGYTNRDSVKHVGYSISKVKQTNEKFCNFTWE